MQYEGHVLRHEYKYYINYDVYHVLRERLKNVIQMDKNMPDEEGYLISSIYFDDMYHSAMSEKLAGVRFRKKFRIRSYERNDALIRLECKSKYDEYISKTSAKLTIDEYRQILNGEYEFLIKRPEVVCRELYAYHRANLLKPVVVVEYRREAYISSLGNVRITFDKELSSSTQSLDIFSKDYHTHRVLPNDMMVLEVKYDDYLPTHISSVIQSLCADRSAISKYVICRDEKRRLKAL